MEQVTVQVIDEGQRGAALYAFTKPNGCPGLGGWKQHAGMLWVTRLKGEPARHYLEMARQAPEGIITLQLEGDEITDAWI